MAKKKKYYITITMKNSRTWIDDDGDCLFVCWFGFEFEYIRICHMDVLYVCILCWYLKQNKKWIIKSNGTNYEWLAIIK